ncbi:MAG: VOC family protein [Burkholderiales bacterium]
MAIVAPSLADGVAYVQQTLGVTMQVGGEHPRMGTHNYFLKLGDKVYLEVISINPAAPRPDRARWFQLDEPDSSRPIRLATWIARTDDIYAAAAASPVPLGDVEPMSRGPINWLITIPKDGSLPLQGIAPALIQWPPGTHPTSTLQDMGCSLVRLEVFHSNTKKVNSVLEAIGFQGDLRVSALPPGEQPYVVAHIQTPTGPRQLSSPN